MKVYILYRSGTVQTIDCEKVSIERGQLDDQLTSINVSGIKENSPKPLYWGIENIEAIWTEKR